MGDSYITVTEVPGIRTSREQLCMLYTRYRFAASLCAGQTVLEVACGAGQGLGYLARFAQKVVGGDIDENNLRFAIEHYRRREKIELRKVDAHQLPFEARSFDVIILYEAIYYLKNPDRFLSECRRILSDQGIVLIGTVNKEWPDFNPSPFSTRYFSPPELVELLKKHHFRVELYGAFPVTEKTTKGRIVSILKRAALALHLMPKTMKGKEILKGIFFGKLVPLPPEVEDEMAVYSPPVRLAPGALNETYKVIYAVAQIE